MFCIDSINAHDAASASAMYYLVIVLWSNNMSSFILTRSAHFSPSFCTRFSEDFVL